MDTPSLVEALEPFAREFADMGLGAHLKDDALIGDVDVAGGSLLTVGHWRALMAALSADGWRGIESALVAGPVWRDDEGWASEVQTIGGHSVVATVYADSQAEATRRRDAVLAALTQLPPPPAGERG